MCVCVCVCVYMCVCVCVCECVIMQWKETLAFWTSTPPAPSRGTAASPTTWSWSRSGTASCILPPQCHSEFTNITLTLSLCASALLSQNVCVCFYFFIYFFLLFVINLCNMPYPRALLSPLCNDSLLGKGTCACWGAGTARDWDWYEEMSVK